MTVLKWAGGEHAFTLDIGGLRAMQAACDAGPEQVLRRITSGAWRVDDLFQPIRLGLIGGGMGDRDAADLATRMFASHPVLAFKPTAQIIVMTALMGGADDPVGEPEGATSPPENGSSAPSTETVP